MSFKLQKPGAPRATAVAIDSVTITWKAQEHASGYKILYRPVDGAEFVHHDSMGTVTTCCVRGLSHGVEYLFKVQAFSKSGETSESDECTVKTREYYDIVMVGKTGQGKSTFGNKLLNLDKYPERKIRLFEFVNESALPHSGSDLSKKKRFIQASDPEVTREESMLSVTAKCKLLANDETNIRVLDVPGFSDSGSVEKAAGKKVSVKEANLQIIRWIVRAQLDFQLKVRRIVYFLPGRGPLEKADGTLQEELAVLHHFFGNDIFDCMVLAATAHKKYQEIGFDDDDIKSTEEVFSVALESAFSKKIKCPPIKFIGMEDCPEECLSKIMGALVLKESVLPLKFQEDTCARCSVKVRRNKEEKISVVHANGTIIPYTESKCHPCFVPKYNMLEKAAGGVGHMLTLGIGLFVEWLSGTDSWPGFTNSDEICVECKKSPGAVGCMTVGKRKSYKKGENDETLVVDHSNKLD